MKLIQKDGYLKAENYKTIEYNDDYFTHLLSKYECNKQSEMNNEINSIRTKLVNEYCALQSILDYGCGTGNFIKYHDLSGYCYTYGYELIPQTVKWLKKEGKYIDPYNFIPGWMKGVCMWDVLEHIPDHNKIFNEIEMGMYLFVSIPIFKDLDKIKESKHYIPNEHLWYFTLQGFTDYMRTHEFVRLSVDNAEEVAGREDIKTFVFIKQ